MVALTRTYNVTEGNSVLVQITGFDIESYSGSVQTVDGTAKAVATLPAMPDYQAFSDSSSGSGAYSATIFTLDDDIYEGPTPEIFKLTGSATTWFFNDDGVLVSQFNTGVFTFRIDDEADRPRLSISPLDLVETDDDQDVTFTVTADHAASFDYTITVSILGGIGDFTTPTQTIVMKAYETATEVTFTMLGDEDVETNFFDMTDRFERFQVTAESAYDSTSGELSILNDDGPTIEVSGISGLVLTEGKQGPAITFTLSDAVPYDIAIFAEVREGDDAQFSLINSGFVIPAGQTSVSLEVLKAAIDNSRFEITQLTNVQFRAVAIGSDEEVRFSGAAGSTNESQVFDLKIRDELMAVLEDPPARASEIASNVLTAIEILNDGMNNGLFGIDTINGSVDALKAAGEVLKKSFAAINIATIEIELLADLQAADNARDPYTARAVAYRRANVALLDMAAGAAVAEGTALFVGGLILGLGAAPGVLVGLATIGVGVGVVWGYQKLISPHVKAAINDALNQVETLPPPLIPQTNVPGIDGDNTYAGTAASERYLVDSSADTITEASAGGYDTAVASASYRLAENVESLVLKSAARVGVGNADANYLEGSVRANTLRGGAGNDLLRGMAGDDALDGGSGDDAMLGGDGNDTLTGGAGNDTLAGGKGTNTLDGGDGQDTAAYGESAGAVLIDLSTGTATGLDFTDSLTGVEHASGSGEADTIVGNDGDNTLAGQGGNDTVSGGAGRDKLDGGDGNDVLLGGGGGDHFISRDGEGADTIQGGSGTDLLEIDRSSSAAGLAIDLAQGGQGLEIGDGTTFSNIERLIAHGGSGGDTISGGALADAISGGGGNDVIAGRGGADRLNGDAGDDTISGGDGDDVISGGQGIDNLSGDAGNDRFVYASIADSGVASERDEISGFTQSADVIDLSAIDAITGGAHDAFQFVGTDEFDGRAGLLRFVTGVKTTVVSCDVDGDSIVDFQIELKGAFTLTSADFVLA